jgi:hypothetical protein
MLFTWVELLSSLVYKKWISDDYSIEKKQGFKNTLQTLVLYNIFPKNV